MEQISAGSRCSHAGERSLSERGLNLHDKWQLRVWPHRENLPATPASFSHGQGISAGFLPTSLRAWCNGRNQTAPRPPASGKSDDLA